MRGFYGEGLGKLLENIHKNNETIQKLAQEWTDANADVIANLKENYGYTDSQVMSHAIEEAMAKMAESGTPFKGALRPVTGLSEIDHVHSAIFGSMKVRKSTNKDAYVNLI